MTICCLIYMFTFTFIHVCMVLIISVLIPLSLFNDVAAQGWEKELPEGRAQWSSRHILAEVLSLFWRFWGVVFMVLTCILMVTNSLIFQWRFFWIQLQQWEDGGTFRFDNLFCICREKWHQLIFLSSGCWDLSLAHGHQWTAHVMRMNHHKNIIRWKYDKMKIS